MFIVFEGLGGSGKTTQSDALEQHLLANGFRTRRLREPGATTAGEKIREVLLDKSYPLSFITEIFLLNAARNQMVSEFDAWFHPTYETDVLLMDRYYYSTIAYQLFGNGYNSEYYQNLYPYLNSITYDFFKTLPQPDMCIYLDIPAELVPERVAHRNGQRYHSENIEYFTRVRNGYEYMWQNQIGRIVKIDGTRPPEQIFADVVFSLSGKMADAKNKKY